MLAWAPSDTVTVPCRMQTRYLILASLITGIAILVAAALWLTRYS